MEVLSGYFTHLPTLKDSTMVVASTKKGNKLFNEATLVGMIMATCPIAWRRTRTLLPDLENIKKVLVEKYNKKAKANKAKVAMASKAGEARVPRKCTNRCSSSAEVALCPLLP